MKKIVRALGATLGATAIVGASAAGANAFGPSHHSGHAHHAQAGGYNVHGVHRQFSHYRHSGDSKAGFTVGTSFDHRWFRHHWTGQHHQQLTFAQKQAAIVARLTKADDRLTALISYLSDQASSNPDGWAAHVLPYLQDEQSKLESLISAVKAATDDQELAAAFKAAFQPPAQPTPPTSTPSS